MSEQGPSRQDFFDLAGHGTDVRTELLAGVTTFMTMAYIIFVNTAILGAAIDIGPGTTAALVTTTCIASALPTLIMGLWARLPIALAPGMGMNAFFVGVCLHMGVDWRIALGAVFWSGIIFMALTVFGLREMIVKAFPKPLMIGIAAGIGLFLAYIGLRVGGFLAPAEVDLTQLGSLHNPTLWVAIFGLLATGALLAWRVPGAILWGILLATAFHHALQWLLTGHPPAVSSPVAAPNFSLLGDLDLWGSWRLGLLEVLIIFVYMDLFDCVGTLLAVVKEGDLFDEKGEIPNINQALLADAFGSSWGALWGTSTVTSYIESAAGIAAGGRTGLTAVVVAALFLGAMFLSPLAGLIPSGATAPALIIVGIMMMRQLGELDWRDWATLLPALLVVFMITFTNAINTGIAFGFIAFTVLMVLAGRARQVSPLIYVLSALFLARYLFLPTATEPSPAPPAAEDQAVPSAP